MGSRNRAGSGAWAHGTERALERTLWAHGTERALERTLWAHGTERALCRCPMGSRSVGKDAASRLGSAWDGRGVAPSQNIKSPSC